MTKRKADCTSEEWQEIRARARGYDAAQRKKPSRRVYMKNYMDSYTKTPAYRENDNKRYGPARRERQLSSMRTRMYRASPDLVATLREIQGHRCAVCQRAFEFDDKSRRES